MWLLLWLAIGLHLATIIACSLFRLKLMLDTPITTILLLRWWCILLMLRVILIVWLWVIMLLLVVLHVTSSHAAWVLVCLRLIVIVIIFRVLLMMGRRHREVCVYINADIHIIRLTLLSSVWHTGWATMIHIRVATFSSHINRWHLWRHFTYFVLLWLIIAVVITGIWLL